MKHSLVFFLVLVGMCLGFVGQVAAQVDAGFSVTEAQILAVTGDTDSDPRNVAVGPGIVYFFESEPDAPTTGANSILSWNGVTVAVYASESAIETELGIAANGLSDLDDLTIDVAGNLYAIAREATTNAEYVIRIPSAGTVEQVVAGAGAEGAQAIDVDETNNALVVSLGDFAGAAAPGLYVISKAANDGTLTLVSPDAEMAAQLTPAPADNLMDISDIVVIGSNDVLVINGYGDDVAGDAGDIIRITGTTESLFAEGSALLAVTGATAFGDTLLEVNSSGEIIAFLGDSSGPAFLVGSADGSTWQEAIDEAGINADPDISCSSSIYVYGNGLAMDPSDNVYWSANAGGCEGIQTLSGGPLPIELHSLSIE